MLTRDALKNGDWLKRLAATAGGDAGIQSEEQLAASRTAALEEHPPGENLWLFGYGSLIWNPAFHYSEQRIARIGGYHRRFCLWTHMGRGSRDCPGLMLGLDRGGSCKGVAFRLTPEQIDEELPLVWRREMVTAAYRARWLNGKIEGSERPVRMLAFTINRVHRQYACGLSTEDVVRSIARAHGPLGHCCEYLFNTTEHLTSLGIHDHRLEYLCRQVRRLQHEQESRQAGG
ncbi:MAG: gamma-glutamylcyclotransferase [Geminicoccaceae bacterium]|nr:gamma-glutamylcyclotransferase [Geminicoccaceae bacterium]MCB9942070.1 gamma-glutamylcyclotransferase [Geminicoccaceae bacterium]